MNSTNVRWIRVNGPFSLEKLCGFQAVPGGTDTDGASFFIVQGFHEGAVHCGKTRVGLSGSIPHGGGEVQLSTYNVLVFNSHHISFRHAIGQHSTSNDWRSVAPGSEHRREIQFPSSQPETPNVLTGLNMLDVSMDTLRVRTHAADITSTHFTALLDSWHDTTLYNARISWLKLATADPDFHSGVLTCQGETTQTVPFNWRFERPPIVYVGLCGADVDKPWHIHVYTSDVTRTDFQLHAETWGETKLVTCWVTWIAFSSDKQGIACGTFGGTTTTDDGYSGSIQFPLAFKRPPMIFIAFTKLDVEPTTNLRVEAETRNVTSTGMDWHIGTWGGTSISKVRVAYLALESDA